LLSANVAGTEAFDEEDSGGNVKEAAAFVAQMWLSLFFFGELEGGS